MKKVILGLIAALSIVCVASAEEQKWIVDPAASSVGVKYFSNDEIRDGRFDTFGADAWFNPSDMENAKLVFTIETESVVFGDQLATDFVKSQDWFWVSEHPKATYTLETLTHIEGDQYKARGVLNLRGVEKTVEGAITVQIAEGVAKAFGQVDFDRQDFEVGVGFTSFLVDIGNDISVLFDLTARPAE
ncbi:MAG: YceI family protein [Pikeienuella sp.]